MAGGGGVNQQKVEPDMGIIGKNLHFEALFGQIMNRASSNRKDTPSQYNLLITRSLS